jgi:putative transcription factor
MICELCGKDFNEGSRIRLEGSLVFACNGCSKLGEVVSQLKPRPKESPKPQVIRARAQASVESKDQYELVDDFGAKVKDAREKKGWTQDDLGKRINEPHSLIHRIEHGRFEPTQDVVRKLEHTLGLRLQTTSDDGDLPKKNEEKKDVTLGDMVVIRRRDR